MPRFLDTAERAHPCWSFLGDRDALGLEPVLRGDSVAKNCRVRQRHVLRELGPLPPRSQAKRLPEVRLVVVHRLREAIPEPGGRWPGSDSLVDRPFITANEATK
jgi:hypothetical protein